MNIKYWIVEAIDSILFSEKCLGCKKPGKILCEECIKHLPKPEHDLPEHVYSLFEYRNPIIKKILTDAKYRKKFSALRVFGAYLNSAIIDIISEYSELNNYKQIILIPVPVSSKRFRMRGYNQAEIIAKSILAEQNVNYILGENIIRKIVDRKPQASIHNRKERLKSPIGTFKIISSEKIAGSLCVIIDDITTTGATIKEMRRILLESGALCVIGITIAH
jgi:competence protein ComFC